MNTAPDREIVLRGYRDGDFEAMYALDVVCFDARFRFSRSQMRRYAEAVKARVAIAEREGALAGFAVLHIERVKGALVGYVMTLDVAPEMRRLGIAHRLMDDLERQAREAGCIAMALHVFTGNDAAIAFYERAGYVRVQAARWFYGPGLDAWVYRKPLAARA